MKLITFDEVRKNNFKSMLLVVVFLAIIAFLGWMIGFVLDSIIAGVVIGVIVGGLYAAIVYAQGSRMLLALTGAKPVTKKEYPHLYHAVEGLSLAAGIPTPKAYVIDDPSPNAFATGRNPQEGAVVMTTGLLQKLNRAELEGVIAHEIYHIKNNDIKLMMMAAVLVGIIAMLSHILLRTFIFSPGRRGGKSDPRVMLIAFVVAIIFAILAPLIGELIKLAISRRREYSADAGAATLTRYPQGLADALRKISGDSNQLKSASTGTAHLYISNPMKKSRMANLFSTHPPIEERIRRLESM